MHACQAVVVAQRQTQSAQLGGPGRRELAAEPMAAGEKPAERWRIEYVKSAMVWTNVPDTMKSMVRCFVRSTLSSHAASSGLGRGATP